MPPDQVLKGLGGWLGVVGIGVVLAPVLLLNGLFREYQALLTSFNNGTWDALTTPGGQAYTPYFDTVVFGLFTFDILFVLACLYQLVLFFSKHYLFPSVFISIALAGLLSILLEALAMSLLFPSIPLFDPDTTRHFLGTLFATLIWVPYMLRSRRVHLTFFEGALPESLHPIGPGVRG